MQEPRTSLIRLHFLILFPTVPFPAVIAYLHRPQLLHKFQQAWKLNQKMSYVFKGEMNFP